MKSRLLGGMLWFFLGSSVAISLYPVPSGPHAHPDLPPGRYVLSWNYEDYRVRLSSSGRWYSVGHTGVESEFTEGTWSYDREKGLLVVHEDVGHETEVLRWWVFFGRTRKSTYGRTHLGTPVVVEMKKVED